MNKNIYDTNFTKAMSEFLITQRKEHRLRLIDISDKLGIALGTYHCYEIGKRDMPMSVFMNICSIYHLDYGQVFRDVSENAKLYTMRGERHENSN